MQGAAGGGDLRAGKKTGIRAVFDGEVQIGRTVVVVYRRHKNASSEGELPVGKSEFSVIAVGKHVAVITADLAQCGDQSRAGIVFVILLMVFEVNAGAQRIVGPALLLSFDAEFTSVVNRASYKI